MLEKPKSPRANWLFWWRTAPNEIDWLAAHYDGLTLTQSPKGQSVLLILFSLAMTAFVALFAGFDPEVLIMAVLMLALGVFIYFGHRWAMIGAMLIWTLEKGVTLFTNPRFAVTSILFWCIFMHAFWQAFRVEQRRRRAKIGAEAFD